MKRKIINIGPRRRQRNRKKSKYKGEKINKLRVGVREKKKNSRAHFYVLKLRTSSFVMWYKTILHRVCFKFVPFSHPFCRYPYTT
jgi:hypothetical protein